MFPWRSRRNSEKWDVDHIRPLWEQKGKTFDEIDLTDDTERSEFYKKIGEGVKTVPQIFIDDTRELEVILSS